MSCRWLVVLTLMYAVSPVLADDAAVRRALAVSEEIRTLTELNEADQRDADAAGSRADSSITDVTINPQTGQKIVSRQGGGESESSKWNKSAARQRIADRERRIAELRAQLEAMPPDVIDAAASARARGVTSSRESGVLDNVKGAGTVDISARILGGGEMDDSSGITGNGLTVSASLAGIFGRGRPGLYFGGEAEIGGFKNHGAIGSVGLDFGVGLRGHATMIAASFGTHYASLYQNASLFPLLGHLAIFGDRWGLFVDAGVAWRKALAGSTTLFEGPMGTRASTFRLTLRRNHVHLGFGVIAMDGDTVGSVYLGGGGLAVDPLQ